jgi:hypothetical protein
MVTNQQVRKLIELIKLSDKLESSLFPRTRASHPDTKRDELGRTWLWSVAEIKDYPQEAPYRKTHFVSPAKISIAQGAPG